MHGQFTRRQARLLRSNAEALQAHVYGLYEQQKDARVLVRQLEELHDKYEKELREISHPAAGFDRPGAKERAIQRVQQQIGDTVERIEETRLELERLEALHAEFGRYAGATRQAFDALAKLLEPEFREELRVEDYVMPAPRLPAMGRLT